MENFVAADNYSIHTYTRPQSGPGTSEAQGANVWRELPSSFVYILKTLKIQEPITIEPGNVVLLHKVINAAPILHPDRYCLY